MEKGGDGLSMTEMMISLIKAKKAAEAKHNKQTGVQPKPKHVKVK
jgi:hypothetical protein